MLHVFYSLKGTWTILVKAINHQDTHLTKSREYICLNSKSDDIAAYLDSHWSLRDQRKGNHEKEQNYLSRACKPPIAHSSEQIHKWTPTRYPGMYQKE